MLSGGEMIMNTRIIAENAGTVITNGEATSILNGTTLVYNSDMGIRALETDSAVVKNANFSLVLALGMVTLCATVSMVAFSTSLKAKRRKK